MRDKQAAPRVTAGVPPLLSGVIKMAFGVAQGPTDANGHLVLRHVLDVKVLHPARLGDTGTNTPAA